MFRYALRLILLLTLGVFTAASALAVKVGEPAPDFSIETFAGEEMSLARSKGQKPLLVVFWTTWCPNCQRELPKLAETFPQLHKQGLNVVAINAGINDSRDRARSFQKRYGLNFPLAFDEDFEISRAFGVWGVPTVFLIDTDGIVRFRRALIPKDLSAQVESLIRQPTGE